MGKKGIIQPEWTKEETQTLIDNYANKTARQIACLLKRTIPSVQMKAHCLGLEKHYRDDLIGKKFNRLLVISFDRVNIRGYWNCLCDCGNMTSVSRNHLLHGRTKSCGCYVARKQYETIKKLAFYHQKRSAGWRKFDWQLSYEQYIEIVKNPCVYCGDMSIRKNQHTKVSLPLNSADRINNEPFYTIQNCQSTCFICQNMKNSMSDLQFKQHINKIMEKQ